jgi:hypothetical protein
LAALTEEFGTAEVPTDQLTAKSPFVQLLFASPGFLGAGFLRELVALEVRIKKQQKDREASLSALLREDRSTGIAPSQRRRARG